MRVRVRGARNSLCLWLVSLRREVHARARAKGKNARQVSDARPPLRVAASRGAAWCGGRRGT